MPTIVTLGKIAIRMFADDHNPPHFHVNAPSGRVSVRIDNLSVMAGRIGKKDLAVALEWVDGHLEELVAEWRHLNER